MPLRRWEDWERSRLRKLRREERRRREFERSHPSGYIAGERDLLSTRSEVRSQYDGSDTMSVTSSEDDQWGPQIGGYNEHNTQYPPPPVGLLVPQSETLDTAKTLDGAELEAMLEMGFDERPKNPGDATKYQLSDSSTQLINFGNDGYSPLSRSTSPSAQLPNMMSPTSPTMPNTSWTQQQPPPGPGRYGPLGPLDPGAKF